MKHLLKYTIFELSVELDATSVKFLTEATDYNDREFADAAEAAYERVYDMLRQKLYQKSGTGFIVMGSYIGSEYQDLLISFVHSSHPLVNQPGMSKDMKINHALGHTKDGRYKVIVCSILIEPGNDKYIETRFQQDGFTHEFIHYLDEKRYGNRTPKSSVEAPDTASYYNHPSEFNAYYQESANSIRKMLRSPAVAKKYMVSFEKFQEFALMMMNKSFIQNMNAKTKLKLTKRLYSMYNGLKEETPTEEEGY